MVQMLGNLSSVIDLRPHFGKFKFSEHHVDRKTSDYVPLLIILK